jgi:hypothetical protein
LTKWIVSGTGCRYAEPERVLLRRRERDRVDRHVGLGLHDAVPGVTLAGEQEVADLVGHDLAEQDAHIRRVPRRKSRDAIVKDVGVRGPTSLTTGREIMRTSYVRPSGNSVVSIVSVVPDSLRSLGICDQM